MRFFYCAAVSFLLCGVAVAQEFFTVVPGTRFTVVLCGTLRVSKAKVGDPIEFRTIEPILIGNGVVVPENAVIRGAVTFVRSDRSATPSSWVRVRIQQLRWKTGQASLNAMVDGVHYVRAQHHDLFHREPRATFLEGIHIEPHLFRKASTDFFSDAKLVVLHDGIVLELRHIVVKDSEDEQPLSTKSIAGKQ